MSKSDHLTPAREFWREEIAKFKSSGLSGAAYCRKYGLSYTTFANWRQRLRREESGKELNLFAKVERLEPNASGPDQVKIQFPNGVEVEMTSLPDPRWLQSLGGVL